MRKSHTFFGLLIAISILGFSLSAEAQRNHSDNNRKRTDDRNHDRDSHNNRDNNVSESWSSGRHQNHDNHDRSRRNDDHHTYTHHNYSRRPAIVYHAARPRYIYYRDYDVYFDHHRNVYISLTPQGWIVTASLPVAMRHVDLRRSKRFVVDYYDDDFTGYFRGRRPACSRAFDGW